MDTKNIHQDSTGMAEVEVGAVVYRGETAESVHHVAVAVVDGSGALTHYLGNPFKVTATRSSVKPFQAIPAVRAGVIERFGLSDKQLAVMCASHNGSDEHREVVESILKATGNSVENLMCGTHWPLQMRLHNEYPTHGEDSDPLRHNCSGKHSGFLALSALLGEPLQDYLNPEARVQQAVRQAVGEYCEYPPDDLLVGIDGCSAPVFSMPLINLAIGFKKLASAEGRDAEERAVMQKIRGAMYAHPLMVSGEKRFDYDLARSFPGNVVCKVGAEAVQGIGFADPPLGIAIKVLDGATRARDPISVEVLRQLGLITDTNAVPHLKPYESPEVKNYRKLVTGRIVPEFQLRRV